MKNNDIALINQNISTKKSLIISLGSLALMVILLIVLSKFDLLKILN